MPAPRMLGSIKVRDRLELNVYFDALPRHGEEADNINSWDEYFID